MWNRYNLSLFIVNCGVTTFSVRHNCNFLLFTPFLYLFMSANLSVYVYTYQFPYQLSIPISVSIYSLSIHSSIKLSIFHSIWLSALYIYLRINIYMNIPLSNIRSNFLILIGIRNYSCLKDRQDNFCCKLFFLCNYGRSLAVGFGRVCSLGVRGLYVVGRGVRRVKADRWRTGEWEL